jgi:hypothetical protein
MTIAVQIQSTIIPSIPNFWTTKQSDQCDSLMRNLQLFYIISTYNI